MTYENTDNIDNTDNIGTLAIPDGGYDDLFVKSLNPARGLSVFQFPEIEETICWTSSVYPFSQKILTFSDTPLEITVSPYCWSKEANYLIHYLARHEGNKIGFSELAPAVMYNDILYGVIGVFVRDESGNFYGGACVSHYETEEAEIELFYLSEHKRGLGLGKAVEHQLEKYLHDLGVITLSVSSYEHYAPLFYEKNGFTKLYALPATLENADKTQKVSTLVHCFYKSI